MFDCAGTFDRLAETAAELLERLTDLDVPVQADLDIDGPERPVVLVAGSLNTGKSSLINDLLGTRSLPDESAVTDTRLYGRVSFANGQAGPARLVFNDGNVVVATISEARGLLSKAGPDDPRLEALDRIELDVDTDLLRYFSLEDSPGHGDAGVGGRFVRRDMSRRAMSSTIVVYLIDAGAQPGESDARFLRPLLDAGVPVHLVFSRFDAVDPDELDGDPRILCVKALGKWGLGIPAERIHFVSSYWHRNGRTADSGIERLAAALNHDTDRGDAYIEAQWTRELAREISIVEKQLGHEIDRRTEVEEHEARRVRLQEMRHVAGIDRKTSVAYEALLVAVSRAVDRIAVAVRAACAAKSDDLQDRYENEWGPTFARALEQAVSEHDEHLAPLVSDLGECLPPLRAPGAPPLVLLARPDEIEIDMATFAKMLGVLRHKGGSGSDSGTEGFQLGRVGKKIIDEIQQVLWVERNVTATREAADRLTSDLLGSASRRLELLEAAIRDRCDENAERAEVERVVRSSELRAIHRGLSRLEQEARRRARHLGK